MSTSSECTDKEPIDEIPEIKLQSDEGTTPDASYSETSTEPSTGVITHRLARQMESTPTTSPSLGDTTSPITSDETKTSGPSTSAVDTSPELSSVGEELNKDPHMLTGAASGNRNIIEEMQKQGRHRDAMLRDQQESPEDSPVPPSVLDQANEEGIIPDPPLPEDRRTPPFTPNIGIRYLPGAERLEAIAPAGAQEIQPGNDSVCNTAMWYGLICFFMTFVIASVAYVVYIVFHAVFGDGWSGNETYTPPQNHPLRPR